MKIPEKRSHGGIGAIPTKCVDEFKPEIIVSYDVFIEHFLKSNVVNLYNHYKLPVFTEFDLQHTQNHQVWGSKHLNVFIRKDIDNHEMFK